MNIKKGDLLKQKNDGHIRKVLLVVDDVYFLSAHNSHDSTYFGCTLKEIEENYIVPKEEWEPKVGESCCYIGNGGTVIQSVWQVGEHESNAKNFLGVYPDWKSAEEARDKIRHIGGLDCYGFLFGRQNKTVCEG